MLGDPICNPESFRLEAKSQRVCAVTGQPGNFLAHHVVYEQDLKRRLGLSGNQLYDTRNARRISKRAHDNHHAAHRRIKTTELTDDNIEYAIEKLGIYAYDYLRRKYDDSEEDPRVAAILNRWVPA